MSHSFEIRSAAGLPISDLHLAMVDSFSDYAVPMQLSLQAFEAMLRQRSFVAGHSHVALVEGEVAAIWLVSVRKDSAYLICSGTRPAYRTRGLARSLAAASLSTLRGAGLASFQTEVLTSNRAADALYRSLGMTPVRLFDCYAVPPVQSVPQRGVEIARWADIAEEVAELRDWRPSWQNNDVSLAALGDEDLLCLCLRDHALLAGYAVVSVASGTVHQLAVRKDLRGQGEGLRLIRAARHALPDKALKLINIDHSDAAFRALMTRSHARETVQQLELSMAL